jgi:hypothetical protein
MDFGDCALCCKEPAHFAAGSVMYAGYLACDPEDRPEWNQFAMTKFTLEQHQLTVEKVHHNLPPRSLFEHRNTRPAYWFDRFAGWDPNYRIEVRVISTT